MPKYLEDEPDQLTETIRRAVGDLSEAAETRRRVLKVEAAVASQTSWHEHFRRDLDRFESDLKELEVTAQAMQAALDDKTHVVKFQNQLDSIKRDVAGIKEQFDKHRAEIKPLIEASRNDRAVKAWFLRNWKWLGAVLSFFALCFGLIKAYIQMSDLLQERLGEPEPTEQGEES